MSHLYATKLSMISYRGSLMAITNYLIFISVVDYVVKYSNIAVTHSEEHTNILLKQLSRNNMSRTTLRILLSENNT